MEKSNIKVAFCPEHGLQFFDAQSRTCEHIPREENSMEIIDKIHQKLATLNLATFELKEVNRLIERAFSAGMAEQADPLEGYSNLTAAISAGESIDWERLDGLKVQCVNPDVGGLHWKLVRNKLRPADIPAGWRREDANNLNVTAFVYSWTGSYGWSLYIEGEVPLRRKTADQLKVGTYFSGKIGTGKTYLLYVGEPLTSDTIRNIYYAPEMKRSYSPASKWEVVEEHGPFQKPESK